MTRAPRLMAIRALDEPGDSKGGLESWATGLARAGVDCLQLRDKVAPDRAVFESCRSVVAAVSAPARTQVVVNRRPDIAAAAGAAGVHLPAKGLPTRAVRVAFGGEFLIGRSTHSLEEVRRAQREGADFVLFGPVFPTPAKLRFGPPRGLDELAGAVALGIPVLAIGGIDEDRLVQVARAGAWGAAAIRLFEDATRAAAIVRRAARLFKEVRATAHV